MRLTLITIALAAWVANSAAATDSPSELVKKLGDKSFKVRAEATTQLEKLGSAAVAALTEGSKHPDPEVAEQCRKLLPQAIAAEQQEKLTVLLRNTDAPPPKGLAGAERFFKVTGDSKAARELYADLMRHQLKAMVALESDPNAAIDLFKRHSEDFNKRFREALKLANNKIHAMKVSPAEITFFFVFAADPRMNKVPKHFVHQSMLVLSTGLRTALTEGDQAAAMQRLYINWLFNESDPVFQRTGFELAGELKMPEFLPRALQVIKDKDAPAKIKAMAMIGLRQIGSKDHVKILTPFLADKTEVDSANFGAGFVFVTQLRDVALGMSVHLAGERPDDYGLGDRRFGDGRGYPQCLYFYGFKDHESRNESHAKWQDWLKKNSESR